MTEADCLFCKMVRGDIPVERIYDDDTVMAFRDIAPRAPVHVLIIPKTHIASANELDDGHDTILGSLFAAARQVAREEGLSERGYRLAFNVGPDGGQTVYHLHLHLLGGRQMGSRGMTTAPGLHTRLREALESLPAGLRDHILRVEEEALRLAALHNVEASRASLAALGHDLVRHLSGPELLAMAGRYGLTPDPIERAEPIIIHGPVAACILARDFGIEDRDIIAGVDCHTTARAGMAPLEKVLFVADKVEPHKRERTPHMLEVRETASSDLDAGVLKYLDWNIEQALRKGWLLHPKTIEARNRLVGLG